MCEKNEVVLRKTLETPLDALTTFLKYTRETPGLKELYTYLVSGMNQAENRKVLADKVYQAPLHELVNIFTSEIASELWSPVLDELDTGTWNKARKELTESTLGAFPAFQRIVTGKNRPELAMAPALHLLLHSTQMMWRRPVVNLLHLSYVLRCAVGASKQEVDRFLKMTVTPEWLDNLYKQAPAGGLAGSLFSLATTLTPDRFGLFTRYALYKRICRELKTFDRQDNEEKGNIISFLGSAAAIGVPIDKKHFPIKPSKLDEIIKLRRPEPDQETINHLQIQLWLGLREIIRLNNGYTSVIPTKYAEEILLLWQATQKMELEKNELLPHVLQRNQDMINWIEKTFK